MSISEFQAIEEFVPHLRRFARALLHDIERADGLVRDCLDEALARWQRQETVANLRVWLFTILHDRYVRLRLGDSEPKAEPENGAQRTETPQSQAATGFTVRDFEQAFRQLPAEDRQILLLIGLEGMSQQEAAEVLGLPLSTLMLRLWQIRKRLRGIELRTNGTCAPAVRTMPRSRIPRPSANLKRAEPSRQTAAVIRFARP